MRLFALLLLAAILGFAVGRLTAPEEGGRGGERSAPPVHGAPPAADALRAEAPTPAPGIDQPPAGTVLPSEEPCEEGMPEVIRVDFNGFEGERTAWLGRATLRGGFEESSETADESGVVEFYNLQPGVYDLWWLDPEGRRVGARAAVEAGKFTTLRAADHRTPVPVPDGLGILSLHLEAVGGGGIATDLFISRPLAGMFLDDPESLELATNARGDVSVAVLPGPYEVRVGDHRSQAVVKEGATTLHRVAHEREGDLVLLADRPMLVSVQSTLDPFEETSHAHATHAGWAGRVGEGEPVLAPYMGEGDYFIYIEWSFQVPLARVAVHAGQTTRIDCKAPGGGLSLKVANRPALRAGSIGLRRVVDGAEEDSYVNTWHATMPDPFEAMLMPGHYIVTASAEGFEPVSAEFEVVDRVVELALELPRAR